MRAEVGDRAERDDAARVGGAAAGHAGDDAVALGHLDQRAARRLGHVGVVGLLDDRREDAVDVEQDGRARGVGDQRREQVVERRRRGARGLVCPPMRRTLQLAVIGTAAGLFSGLFGVGGGTVIVPLLILLARLRGARGDGHVAARDRASSPRAAPRCRRGYGNVDVQEGLLVGLPAVVGVLGGTALQQRVPAGARISLRLRRAARRRRGRACSSDGRRARPGARRRGRRRRRDARRRRRRAVRARADARARPRPARGGGDVAAGDRPRVACSAPSASSGYGNVRVARRRARRACSASAASRPGWRSPTPCRERRPASRLRGADALRGGAAGAARSDAAG